MLHKRTFDCLIMDAWFLTDDGADGEWKKYIERYATACAAENATVVREKRTDLHRLCDSI